MRKGIFRAELDWSLWSLAVVMDFKFGTFAFVIGPLAFGIDLDW